MNPIPEPPELLEAECNAQGPYGLPPEAFAPQTGDGRSRDTTQAQDPTQDQAEEPRPD